jgi:DNA polymerase III subunit delta'
MPMHNLVGHQEARRRLSRAVRSDRLPQVLAIVGPSGVGKQRLALWLAQLLLCKEQDDEPCAVCRGCRQVLELGHPDLHWFVPIPRPKAADPNKQVDEAAEALAEVMEERRARGLYNAPDGMASHGLASVRLLHRRAALTPAVASRKIFILGDADRLVVQESSPEAANALLKLLEEPHADSVFVLTTTDPRRLLPTIRSRAVPLRLGRLTDDEVAAVLRAGGLGGDGLQARVSAAGGSVGAALANRDAGGAAYEAARELLEAVLTGQEGLPGRMERALRQTPWAARGEFTAMLDALADTLGEAARAALGGAPRLALPRGLDQAQDAAALIRAIDRVADAREAAAGNVNPQLLLANLGEDLAEVL